MKIKNGKYLMLALALSILTACNGNTEESIPPKETSEVTANDTENTKTSNTSNEDESNDEVSKTDDQPVDEKDEEAEEVKEDDVDKEDKMEEDQEDSEDSTEKEALFEQIKTENDKVRKVLMKTKIQKIDPENTTTQTFDADALYGDDLQAIKADTISESSDGYYQEFTFDENDNSKATILERQAGEEETTVTEATVDNFDLHPDYHRLIQSVMDLKDELEVSEDNQSIKLSLKEDAKDVLKYIENEYNIQLKLVEEDEIEKSMEIEFDKESKLLKSINLELDPQIDELKDHKITIESLFTDHDFNNN